MARIADYLLNFGNGGVKSALEAAAHCIKESYFSNPRVKDLTEPVFLPQTLIGKITRNQLAARLVKIAAIAIAAHSLLSYYMATPQIPLVDPALVSTNSLASTNQILPQITLVTAYDKNVKEYADYVVPNQVAYATKQGLRHVSYEGNLAHDNGVFRAPYWSKVVALNDQLQKGKEGEWFAWLDASAIFTNSEKTFRDIIHRYGRDRKSGIRKDIIMTTDPMLPINNAVFLVRNKPWTRDWIKKVWARIDLARGGEGNCGSKNFPHCHYEQQAMTELFERDPDVQSHTVVIPNKEMNSFYRYSHYDKHRKMELIYDRDPESSKWTPGDFVCKVTGMDKDRRLAIIKHVVANCLEKSCERKEFNF